MSESNPRNVSAEIAVVIWAAVVATYSQYASFVNRYIVNGDAPAAISWMHRFRDPQVFNDDLLTAVARQIHGQIGFVSFYRLLAPVVDPLALSRFMPIVLLALFALYTFRLVRRFSTTFAALMAAGLAITAPTYLDIMAGGHQRSFALPMLMAFLYYASIAAWRPVLVVLVLQALFYPMAFLICVPTYALTLVLPPGSIAALFQRRQLLIWFGAVVIACVVFLSIKNVFAPDPAVGRILTRVEMEGRPEYYAGGRTSLLPPQGLVRDMRDQLVGLSRALSLDYPRVLLRLSPGASKGFVIVPLVLMVIAACVVIGRAVGRGAVVIPPILSYFVAAGVVMYILADWLLFRLYLPNRYLLYTVQLAGLLLAGLFVGYLVDRIKASTVRWTLQVLFLVAVAARVDLTRNIGLSDQSAGKPLFEFLETLPPEAMIAAHPYAADYIPTFAHRKVFLNSELSYPFYDVYWRTVTARTTAFFNAYYAATRKETYDFCVANGIDYLVVRGRDFQPDYLATNKIYFEPFNTEIRQRGALEREHALSKLAASEKLFQDGDVFVISREILKDTSTASPVALHRVDGNTF